MPSIVIFIPPTHPMIPPYREAVQKIKTLTKLNAQPRASGLQTTEPFMIQIEEGTQKNLDTIRSFGFHADFA